VPIHDIEQLYLVLYTSSRLMRGVLPERQCMLFELQTCPAQYVHFVSFLCHWTPPSPVQALVLRILVALALFDILCGPSRIQHVPLLLNCARLFVLHRSALAECARLELALHGNGSITAEALAHIDHALLALGVALLQLLALGRQGVFEGRAQTFAGAVPLDHDAVAVLQAKGQCSTCSELVSVHMWR
jgi:hypothetical protein